MAEEEAREALAQRRRIADVVLEAEAAAGDQVVADVVRAIVLRRGQLRLAREPDGALATALLGRLRAAWRAARPNGGSDRASENPSRAYAPAGSSRRICSTRLTRSKNSGQSIDDSSRMLVMTLPIAS